MKREKLFLYIFVTILVLIFSKSYVAADDCWNDSSWCNSTYEGSCDCSSGTRDLCCSSYTVCLICRMQIGVWYTKCYTASGDCEDGGGSSCSCCTPTTSCACGPTYSSSNLGYGSTTVSCSNGCGGTASSTCYCMTACTPAKCDLVYVESGQPGASTTVATTKTCTNACNNTQTRNCYYYSCDYCTLPSCPAPLINPGSQGPNDPVLTNYVSCRYPGLCVGSSKYGNCYEPYSNPPTLQSLYITLYSDQDNPNGYVSDTVSGQNLNNPINISAGFTDSDGITDIESVYFWFNKDSSTPVSPQYIDTNDIHQQAQTGSNTSWGFMLHKEDTTWEPYVPSMNVSGQTDKWVKADKSMVGEAFDILGPNASSMVRISNYSTPVQNGLNLDFNFDIEFLDDLSSEKVSSTTSVQDYNIFAMANDVFGFTPYDNYPAGVTRIGDYWAPGQIRNYDDYIDSGVNWKIDIEEPNIDPINVSVVTISDIPYVRIDWDNLVDVQGVAGVTVDILYNGDTTDTTIPVSVNSESSFTDVPLKLTSLSPQIAYWTDYSFRVLGTGSSGYALMNVSNYDTGSFTFHITGFDIGGNVAGTSDVFLLDDWVATRGGYVYSSGGSNIEIRDIVLGSWSGVSNLVDVGFNEDNVDITSEGVGVSSSSSIIPTPITSGRFGFRPYREYPSSSLYNELRLSFLSRVSKLGAVSTTLSGNQLCSGGDCITPIYYADIFTDLSLNPGFSCNGKGVIFVSGNLVIRPNMEVGVEGRDGCIFVVSGNVSILDDVDATPGVFEYDEVNALILSDGTITVGNSPSTPRDALLIKGGLYALGGGGNSLVLNRRLSLLEKNVYPALAVYASPNYRYISTVVFGSKLDILKTEVGFKPY